MSSTQRGNATNHFPGTRDIESVASRLTHNRHLQHIRKYVNEHIEQPLELKDVAAHVGISGSYLSHLFTENTGVPFSAWVRHERIRRATVLLSALNKTIPEIAAAVGYRNVRTFERAFKCTTGMSPGRYRKYVRAKK